MIFRSLPAESLVFGKMQRRHPSWTAQKMDLGQSLGTRMESGVSPQPDAFQQNDRRESQRREQSPQSENVHPTLSPAVTMFLSCISVETNLLPKAIEKACQPC